MKFKGRPAGIQKLLLTITFIQASIRRRLHDFRKLDHMINYFSITLTATGHSLGDTLAQDTKGTQSQMTFNKGTSLHDVLFKRRKSTQTDYRNKGDLISVLTKNQRSGKKVNRSGKWKNPLAAHKL
jgi:hypothetical protein